MGWQPAPDSCSLQAPDASRCGRSSGRIGCPRAPLPAPFRGFQTLLANINSVIMKSVAACSCVEEKGRMLHLKRVFSESTTSASAGTARATWAGTQLGTGVALMSPAATVSQRRTWEEHRNRTSSRTKAQVRTKTLPGPSSRDLGAFGPCASLLPAPGPPRPLCHCRSGSERAKQRLCLGFVPEQAV